MQLKIEKLVYGGDGLARTEASEQGRRATVFVPFVLPGETVEARVVERKPSLLRARAEQIVTASPERVVPACPYFTRCGGCQYQHAAYDCQLQNKAAILAETVQRLAGIEPPAIQTHASPPWNYRNRTRLKVRSSLAGARQQFTLGYYRSNSHDLLAIEQCPVASPLINRAITALWQLGRTGLFSEAITEIELFANAADDRLLAEVMLAEGSWKRRTERNLAEFAAAWRRAMPEVVGVAAFHSSNKGAPVRAELAEDFREPMGADELRYEAAGHSYRVGAGSFFQTNRHLTDTLAELVTAGRTGDTAVDLYAGVGLFSLPLARQFERVIAVEAAAASSHDLRRNAPANVEAVEESSERYLASLEREAWADLIVVDPPRSGLGEATAKLLAGRTDRVTYVSCDPATLARDLRVLLAAGFRIEQMHLLDLFPQTFHLESVTQLIR